MIIRAAPQRKMQQWSMANRGLGLVVQFGKRESRAASAFLQAELQDSGPFIHKKALMFLEVGARSEILG
jgi:hypothetical protein